MTAARRVLDLAARAGIGRSETAVAAGMAVRTLDRWASGHTRPRPVDVRGLRNTVGALLNDRIAILAELHDEVQAIEPDTLCAAPHLQEAAS